MRCRNGPERSHDATGLAMWVVMPEPARPPARPPACLPADLFRKGGKHRPGTRGSNAFEQHVAELWGREQGGVRGHDRNHRADNPEERAAGG